MRGIGRFALPDLGDRLRQRAATLGDADWGAVLGRGVEGLRAGCGLTFYTVGRCYRDRCPQVAASLTYTTLLSLVPLLTIAFAIFAAFPVFDDMRAQILALVFSNMVPEIGEVVEQNLTSFSKNVGKLTAVGIVFVAVTSVMMLNTIETAFNTIWRAAEPRRLVLRILSFWAMLTLGPLLFGASLSMSSYLFAATRAIGMEQWTGFLPQLAALLPFAVSLAGFTFLFLIVPNFPVHRNYAVVGGVVTAILFELLKRGFGLYIAKFGSYQTIYGALSAVPIFLLWVYLCWLVVLFGAELTASLPEWRVARGFARSISTPGRRLSAALGLLAAILKRARSGAGFKKRDLLLELPVGSDILGEVLARLVREGFVARGEKGQWLLARDLETVTLHDLFHALDLTLGPTDARGDDWAAWHDRLDTIIANTDRKNRERLAITLKELLGPALDGEAPPQAQPQAKSPAPTVRLHAR